MATFNRPGALPLWCENNQTNVAAPTQTLQDVGYTANEVVLAENWNYWLNLLGHWVGYLDQAAGATLMSQTLDMSTRLLEGGHWSWDAASGTLAWDAPAILTIPGATRDDNTLPAGSAVLAPGQCLYVTAHVPYTSPVDLTQGSTTLANVLVPSQIAVGYTVTGPNIPANTTVVAIDDSNVTISQAATATASQAPLTFAGTGSLAAAVATMASFTPGPSTVILAVAQGETCLVGANSGQMLLRPLERKRLLGTGGYVSTLEAPAGQDLTQGQAVYLSAGTTDSRTQGALYPCDPGASNGATRSQCAGIAAVARASGALVHVVTAGLVGGFTGLTAGAAYYLDPTNPGGLTTTAPTTPGQYTALVGYGVTPTTLWVQPAPASPVSAVFQQVTVNGLSSLSATSVSGPVTLQNNTTTSNLLSLKPTLAGSSLAGYAASKNGTGANTWSISDAGVLTIQSISNAAGLKTNVWMGTFATSSAQATSTVLQTLLFNDSAKSMSTMPRQWTAPYNGLVLAIQVHITSSVAFAPTFNVQRVTTELGSPVLATVQTTTLGTNTLTTFYKTYPRGSVAFNAQDQLYVQLQNPPSGAALQIEADVVVELAS